ncbi:hypothetical protein P3L10_007018 [Capsicum annuum]
MTNQQPNPSQSTDAINSANTTATDINLPTANTIHDNHTTITDAGGIAHAVQAKLAKLEEGSSSIDIRHGTHLGKPTVFFSAEDYFVNLAKDCKYTIIEKFYKGKPSMEEIRKVFVSQFHLTGPVKIAYFNFRHVYIDFANEVDFNHV